MASYYVWSAAAGAANGTSWANAYTTLKVAMTSKTAGDIFYVAHDSAETGAVNLGLALPGTPAVPSQVLCVNRAGSVPPVSADLRTTASITTTSTGNIVWTGTGYVYGIISNIGTGANTAALQFGNASGIESYMVFKDCKFNRNSTTAQQVAIGYVTITQQCIIKFINSPIKFGNTSDSLSCRMGTVIFEGGTAFDVAGPMPTVLITSAGSAYTGGDIVFDRVDGSGWPSGTTLLEAMVHKKRLIVRDFKEPPNFTLAGTPTSIMAGDVDVQQSSSGVPGFMEKRFGYSGSQGSTGVVVRTDGPKYGTKPITRTMATSANASWTIPLRAIPVDIWNSVATSAILISIQGVWNGAALPNNDEFWVDVEYLGSATDPLGSVVSSGKADFLATPAALSASVKEWDTQVTARANSTAYALGDIIKLASNSGRIFFCTTAGTSDSSEPGGFASAIDGGSVTDNTAVFRAGVRFSTSVTVTPQLEGYLRYTVIAARASASYYYDLAAPLPPVAIGFPVTSCLNGLLQ